MQSLVEECFNVFIFDTALKIQKNPSRTNIVQIST